MSQYSVIVAQLHATTYLLSFRLLQPSTPEKSLKACQKPPTVFIVYIAVNPVAHLIHFKLKKV